MICITRKLDQSLTPPLRRHYFIDGQGLHETHSNIQKHPPSPRPPILPLTRAMHLSLVAVPPGCSQSQLCVKMKKESYNFTVYRAVGRSENPVGHNLPYAWLE